MNTKNFISGLTIILMSAFFLSPTFAEDVRPLMRQNFNSLIELQKLTADPKRFVDPEVQSAIKKHIDQLAGAGHVLPQLFAEKNPSLAAIGAVFSDYMNGIQRNLGHGNPYYVRNQIRTVSNFCMECHTGVSTDKNFIDMEKRVESMGLPPFELAEFYAATRQFDKAVKTFEKILSKTVVGEEDERDLSRALKGILSVTVRVQKDPEKTLAILNGVERQKNLSPVLLEKIRQWKEDTLDWKKESVTSNWSGTSLLKTASNLAAKGASIQEFPADHAADVTYLRTTNLVNEALAKKLSSEERAQAYYLLGVSYGVLEDPLLWALDDVYFEACVREAPHTSMSQKCFNRFSQELYFGYTGSMGTDVPAEEVARLRKLRALAY